RRVAPQARISLDDLQLDVGGRRDDQGNVVPQGHDANHPILEPLRGITHGRRSSRVLLEALRLHEGPEIAVLVEVLHLRIDHVRRLQGLPRTEGLLDGSTGLEIADLDAVEGLPLAGLDELVLDDGVGLAIQKNLHAAADFARGVAGHFVLTWVWCRMRDPIDRTGAPKGPRMITATTPPRD